MTKPAKGGRGRLAPIRFGRGTTQRPGQETPPEMRVEYVAAAKLKPAAYNPRKMTPKERADLTESLKRFGFAEPIVVNRHRGRENVVVGGHQRLEIAKALGLDPVPCVYVDLDEKRERDLNLRLNKNLGAWDWPALMEFKPSDLLAAGFLQSEIDGALGADAPRKVEFETKGKPRVECPKCGHRFVPKGASR